MALSGNGRKIESDMVGNMQICEASDNRNELDKFLAWHAKNAKVPVFLYGAGRGLPWYSKIMEQYNIPVEAIIDGKLVGEAYYQIKEHFVYSLQKICEQYSDAIIVISAPAYRKEIYKRIKEEASHYKIAVFDPLLDIIQGNSWRQRKEYFESKRSELITLREILADDLSKVTLDKFLEGSATNSCECYSAIHSSSQYFPDIVMQTLRKNEIFVDVGAYVGDSVQEFIDATSDCYKKIIAFEPDPYNFEKAKNTIRDERIEWYPKGVGDKNGTLYFQNEMGALDEGAHVVIDENRATSKIEIVKLDDFIKEEVTYIKMDIEGMELNAIKGASNLIRNQKPKLAISVYHKTEDIVEIPRLILQLNPEYKLYLRHFWESNSTDTVLFAL